MSGIVAMVTGFAFVVLGGTVCLYVARTCSSMLCMTITTASETAEPIAIPCTENMSK